MNTREIINDMFEMITCDLTIDDDISDAIYNEINRRTIYTQDCFNIIKQFNIVTDYNSLPYGSNSLDAIARGILVNETYNELYDRLVEYQDELIEEEDEEED